MHLLVGKEIKAGKTHVKDELSDEKKRKIKIFVKDYMDKVMVRRAQKLAAKAQESAPGPSESVSTSTPQLPGSTPRDELSKEVEPDTPLSNSASKIENGDLQSLSPSEFLKTLEQDGFLES